MDEYLQEPLEQWLATNMSGPDHRPDAFFIALNRDGEAVDYAQLLVFEAQPTRAHNGFTAVKRAWRGRGIAGALKATQIRWAKEAGFERMVTGNEELNAPIVRLNKRFGYRPIPGRIRLRGPIARPE